MCPMTSLPLIDHCLSEIGLALPVQPPRFSEVGWDRSRLIKASLGAYELRLLRKCRRRPDETLPQSGHVNI